MVMKEEIVLVNVIMYAPTQFSSMKIKVGSARGYNWATLFLGL
jgi:hypothetical protein